MLQIFHEIIKFNGDFALFVTKRKAIRLKMALGSPKIPKFECFL